METFTSTFSAFLNEAQFTKELLAIGVTQLYKANYATKGLYYLSFTCLSTGIERMEKLCLILDYYILNNGVFPQEEYVRQYEHKIQTLLIKSQEIAKNQQINFHFLCKLDDEIHQSIIDVLSNFAVSSGRYSNINVLLGKNGGKNDCMYQWFTNVDKKLFEKCISSKKKVRILDEATEVGKILEQFSSICYATEDNTQLSNAVEASKRTGIWEAVAPYRQVYTLQIIRYFAELLIELGDKAWQMHLTDIPFLREIFGQFLNDDAYFRRRKTWGNL